VLIISTFGNLVGTQGLDPRQAKPGEGCETGLLRRKDGVYWKPEAKSEKRPGERLEENN